MSIIEDSVNLPKGGQWVCGVTFFFGCLFVFSLWAQTAKIPALYKETRKEGEAKMVLQAKPEELKTPYGGLPPKDSLERTRRTNGLKEEMRQIENEVSPDLPLPPSQLLEKAVSVGAIHPQRAQNLSEEIKALAEEKPSGD